MARKVDKGRPLEELTKGSINYTVSRIRKAFYEQFVRDSEEWMRIEEFFDDHVIVEGDLPSDEFYYVPYERVDGAYVFVPRDEWEIVELTYQPQTSMDESGGARQRMVERIEDRIELLEATDEDDRHRIRAIGITADVVNGNGRRYPAHVLEAAVRDLRTHLHESAGQGRAMQLLGEAEHPSDKPTRRANLLETVVKWDEVEFDGRQVILEGSLLQTAKGKDILALLEGGVIPDISQRAYGKAELIEEDGQTIEEVLALTITGYDLVIDGSDPHAGVTLFESEEEEMELNLEMLKEKYPDLVEALLTEHDEEKKEQLREMLEAHQREEQRKRDGAQGDAALREILGLDETADLTEAMRQQAEELQALREEKQQREVTAYIEEQVGEIKYPAFLKKQFAEAVKNAGAETIDEAKKAIIEKRKEYDGIMAAMDLQAQGFRGGVGCVMGPVIESELGVPAYAAGAYQLQESLMRSGHGRRWDHRKPTSVNEEFAAVYLEAYDEAYKAQLIREQRAFEEAEQTSDLNIPYSVMRAVIAEAFPELVATSIFDFGMMAESTARMYYEEFEGETSYTGSVTNEDVTADSGSWVAMDYKRITPGSVTVTSDGGGTTYTEGDDYVIDYANGEIMALSSGDISDGASLDVDYSYTAIREGEMGVIQRGKMTLTYKTIEAAADRLATQISSEAIKFSRSQIGYDAVTRTLASLVRQVRRKVDQGILYAALSAALRVSSNTGGTWTAATDEYDDLVKYLGLAKVKVANRYYEPTFVLSSVTNGDKLSNWDGFKRDGFPDAVLNANGFVGRVKGLPVFESTEFSDSYMIVGNRELVMHRVYSPMELKGPFPTYDVSGSTSKLVAADQYYAEEYNATEAPVPQKGAYVVIS